MEAAQNKDQAISSGSEKDILQVKNSSPVNMFEVMVQNAPVSMYILEDWSYSYVNEHFCELVGYTKEELLHGKITIDQLVHPDDLSIVRESVKKRIENEDTKARYRVRAFKKDGGMMHVEIHASKAIADGKQSRSGPFLM
ncbi:hypothetical protein BB776_05755 [Planococcus salinarum]|uniref:PAS domain-containing protein n=1 Tax=Planococcus salinarum TaxID=622695 RepID=A0ABX3D205_9BACL|nr:PAS domain-containing protein [Planococcus salinarum]OHX54033.1 hypothetical protein BB776_05755 [Planococcus salinarum]